MILQNFLTLNIFNIFTCLTLTTTLFFCAVTTILLNQKNLMILLIAIEIMLFSINLQFLFIASHAPFYLGYIYSLLNVILAAAESALGLTFLLLLYRIHEVIHYDNLTLLRQ